MYKSGYRYYDAPIGAAIDSDSHNTILNFDKFYSRGSLQIKYQKMLINQNNSINHSLSTEAFANEEVMLKISRYYKNNFSASIEFYF